MTKKTPKPEKEKTKRKIIRVSFSYEADDVATEVVAIPEFLAESFGNLKSIDICEQGSNW